MARPPPDKLRIPWLPKDPCPCGTGAIFGDCCLSALDLLPLNKLPKLTPPGPTTGYSHAKCYLGFTADCSADISREHYISEVVLRQYPNLTVSGLPWVEDKGAAVSFSTKALASNILCARHNSALSPLDQLGAAALSKLAGALDHATSSSSSRETAYFLLNGQALELWTLKVLAGTIFASVSSSGGKPLKGRHHLDQNVLRRGLVDRTISRPLGMYVTPEAGNIADHSFAFAPLTNFRSMEVNGLALKTRGLLFAFVFDLSGADRRQVDATLTYRPWMIDLIGPRRTSRVVISWNDERKSAKGVQANLELVPNDPP